MKLKYNGICRVSWLVLPQSWPMIFEKIDIVRELKLSKSWEYLWSWSTSKTEGLYFGPERMSHLLSRYLISYKWLQNSVTNRNWSNIWALNDLFFSDQNITPRFLRYSSFPNILKILTILILVLHQFFRKASVMTVATLWIMVQAPRIYVRVHNSSFKEICGELMEKWHFEVLIFTRVKMWLRQSCVQNTIIKSDSVNNYVLKR